MEKKITEEINRNIEEYRDYGYLMEYTNNKDKVICTADTCLINWYRSKDDLCYDDESMNLFYLDSFEKVSTPLIKQENIVKDTKETKYKNLIENLSLVKFERDKNTVLKQEDKEEITFFEYSKIYSKFIQCINIKEGKKSVNIFDMDVFYRMFQYPYIDNDVITFIKKLKDDNMLYEAKDKQNFVIILIYAYLFIKKHKIDVCLKEKIRKNIIYVKSEYKYRITYINDYNIDKYILKIRKVTTYHEESLFLNYFYVTYISKPTIEKYIFIDFQQRINKAMKNIDPTEMLSFLRNIFFFQTVLYNCLDESQVFKGILDFYNKKNKNFNAELITKYIYEFLYNISLRCVSIKLYDLVVTESLSLFGVTGITEANKKSGYLETFILLNSRTLKDFNIFIEENNDSYNSMKRITDILFDISDSIQGCSLEIGKILELIELYLFLYEKIKIEFFMRILKQYVKNMVVYLETINKYCKDNFSRIKTGSDLNLKDNFNRILLFNKTHWLHLSKLVLSLQRCLVVLKEEKKKKKLENLSLEKSFLRLTENIYEIEHQLIEIFEGVTVVEIKYRSFKMEDIKQ